jgi:type 1 fimbriae regulatory protein FimB
MAIGTDALPWLFISERGQPLTRQSVTIPSTISSPRRLPVPGRRRCIRTCCGTPADSRSRTAAMTQRLIQDYLGHRDPKHTVHYTRVAAGRFEGLWR